ncbi:hypothetical protein FITA111629_15540 [Filibacter tadaridae]|uniref:Uncharacterized protein n=1 Tax=Filibacter tadaridae TaxID=2483811 RepID=A0A3P5XSW9_9BACL|nr:hypothetical protein [Filibacter tadaridae]VDC33904.1 hypothetical protein FILTAD_03081 [Filibacter tadaridae]
MGILLPIIMATTVFLTFYSFSFAILKRSWRAMLISFIASLPISMYFAGVNPPLSFLGLAPILFLTLTIIFRRRIQREFAQKVLDEQ